MILDYGKFAWAKTLKAIGKVGALQQINGALKGQTTRGLLGMRENLQLTSSMANNSKPQSDSCGSSHVFQVLSCLVIGARHVIIIFLMFSNIVLFLGCSNDG